MEVKTEKKLTGAQSFFILCVALGLLLYGVGVLKVNPAVGLIFSSLGAIYIGMGMGCKWSVFEENMGQTVKMMFMGMAIMMFVGILIGSWMSSGTIPLMMYYGLKYLPAPIFLIAACLLCSAMSLMTGTSWGTMGTIGVALMGAAQGLGIPLPQAAGAIVVGALVGDKLSPLSDTTIVAPSVCNVNIYDHIKSMLYTTLPCLVISLVFYAVLGLGTPYQDIASSPNYLEILNTLEANFKLDSILLLPPFVVLVLIFFRKPTLPVFGIGIVIAIILSIWIQGNTLKQVLTACTAGLGKSTGVAVVDKMVNRGGLMSMMPSVALIIGAAIFSSSLKSTGVFAMFLSSVEQYTKGRKSLLFFSYTLHLILASLTGVYLVTFAIVGPLLAPLFDRFGLSRRNLSRMLEDTGTAFSPIVPWSNISIFILGTLGLGSFEYILYAPLTYLGVVFAAFYIVTGIGIYNADGTLEASLFKGKQKKS